MGCGASASELQQQLNKQTADIAGLQAEITAATAAKDLEVAQLQTRIRQYEAGHKTGLGATASANSPNPNRPEMCLPCSVEQTMPPSLRKAFTMENSEARAARGQILKCLRFRKKYMVRGSDSKPLKQVDPASVNKLSMVLVDGVADVPGIELPASPSREEYRNDLVALWKLVKAPEVKSMAYARLERLSAKFKSYSLDYSGIERETQTSMPGDIFSVSKVDNHIHLAAAMPPTMLLQFIQKKIKTESDQEVAPGKTLKTLILESLNCADKNLAPEAIADMIFVNSLRMCAGDHFYHRFDVFNDAYCPFGSSLLRSVFLKTSNHMDGRYFAELTHEVIASYDQHHSFAEMRLSIYGSSASEWDALARWVKKYDLHGPKATKRNLWMVQIPRVFKVFFAKRAVNNFEDLLNNIFQALFEVVLDPSSHPELAEVLPSIVGIDCVDDESVADPLLARRSMVYGDDLPTGSVEEALRPSKWAVEENPPYSYYAYFLHTNLRRFNDLCQALGRPWKLTFRPHAGEAGEVHHLATAFLLADSINHGINLWHSPVLQYLYYLTQLGVSVSPISNNALFLKLKDNPFPYFFRRGLNVTLSTDDPLMFHSTDTPLLEEYTAAKLIFGLSDVDLSEIAANSVRQSGFPAEFRIAALGGHTHAPYAWNPSVCNVPNVRLGFRRKNLAQELAFLRDGAAPNVDCPEPEGDAYWRTALD